MGCRNIFGLWLILFGVLAILSYRQEKAQQVETEYPYFGPDMSKNPMGYDWHRGEYRYEADSMIRQPNGVWIPIDSFVPYEKANIIPVDSAKGHIL